MSNFLNRPWLILGVGALVVGGVVVRVEDDAGSVDRGERARGGCGATCSAAAHAAPAGLSF